VLRVKARGHRDLVTVVGHVVTIHSFGEIRRELEETLHWSNTWPELFAEIAKLNLELTPKGGGLCVRWKDTKTEICKASEVGLPYSRLIKHFGKPFPGHPHQRLADRILGKEDSDKSALE
jgi:hypothetical protein